MRVDGAWQLLGIASTDDAQAIRRAYAERLRAMDVDADPEGFAALRAAREIALGGSGQPTADNVIAERLPEAHGAGKLHAPPERAAVAPDPAEVHRTAIATLLTGDYAERWLPPEDKAALIAHWHGLCADPRMAEIDFLDRIERWAAWTIAANPPFSAPLIIPAVKQFGWDRENGTITQEPILAEICRRHSLIRFLEGSSKPGSSFYPAWAELHAHAYPGSSRGRVDPYTVHEILTVVREVMPELELRFDSKRVALWADNTADPDHPETRRIAISRERLGRAAGWISIGYTLLIVLSAVMGALRRG